MTDVPQWAVERARELAALWNDPGQEAAIARALAEAREEGRRDTEATEAYQRGLVVLRTTSGMFKPAAPEVG